MLLFYVPSAIVAVWLNRAMPLEGGLYQWAKIGFNESIGFIVAWNLWLFAILNMTNVGLQFTQYLGYIFGPRVAGFTAQNWVISATTAMVVGALVWITIVGLRVGKWVHTAGGVLMLGTFAMIIALPWLNVANGTLAEFHPLQTATPVISLLSLNLLGKMGFGAFGGFEYVAIHAGECRDPVRSITRATVIGAPIIVLMFVLGTSSVLGMIPIDDIDLIAPIPQLLTVGFGPLGAVAAVAPLTLSAMLAIRFAQASVNFAGSTRLPMVAGWDSLLPAWFTRLSERYRTPVNSILFVGAADVRVEHARARRRRPSGGVSAALEFSRDLLRAHVPGDVRDSARGTETRKDAHPLVGEALRPVRLHHDGALRRALGPADHSGRQPDGLRAEDCGSDPRDERDRGRAVLVGTKAGNGEAGNWVIE